MTPGARRVGVLAVGVATALAAVPLWPGSADARSTRVLDHRSVLTASSEPPGRAWRRVVPGGSCECADGSEFAFFVRRGDPTRVMLFLEAGGACWDAVTCAFLPTATYDFDVGDDDHPERRGGVFDAAEAANPLADYSVVYVPYCTGDVHLGDTARDYLPVLTVAHRGAPNAGAALDHLVAEFADAEHVLVAGESAGAIASPLYGGLAADRLPRARVTVLADGAGAYPDVPFVNGLLGRAWGVLGAVPDWPENERAPVEEWSFPSLWVRAGRHDPSIVMARFDFASDDVQQSLTPLSGMLPGDIASLLADNENTIEAAGVEQLSYTAPGDGHTVLGSDTFYTLEVDGVALVDWVGALVAGAELSDVPADESRRRR